MKAIIFDSENEARAFMDKVNAAEGYPKKGKNIGTGRHGSEEETMTLSAFEIHKKANENKYAILVDDAFNPKVHDATKSPEALNVSDFFWR